MVEKIVLALIAVGLLWNALNPWILPSRVEAEYPNRVIISDVEKYAFDRISPVPVDVK